jgi:hypothetical protein
VSYASLIQGSTFDFERSVTADAFAIESAKHPEALPISICPPTENCSFISTAGSRSSVGFFAITTRRAGAAFITIGSTAFSHSHGAGRLVNLANLICAIVVIAILIAPIVLV